MLRGPVAACALGCALIAGAALAETDPDNAVKYRQQVYKTLGANITGIVMNLRQEVAFADAVATHAELIAASAPLALPAMVQDTAGQGSAQTKAKDEIWANWDEFEGLHQDMEAAADELLVAASAGDMAEVGAKTQALGATCKACHDKYRE